MTLAEADRDVPLVNELPLHTVHVWRVFLDRTPGWLEWHDELLCDDERDRACRFYFERDRRRFTVARGALRMILSGYSAQHPESIRFEYGPQGKPHLASSHSEMRFNLAHSEELALIAVARERELGIDVERIRSFSLGAQRPEDFFSPREVSTLRALSGTLAEEAFFRCWTRKEAYIKARGGGLSIPLDSFDVSLEAGEPAALLAVRGDATEASRWSMQALHPAAGYAGALVAEGKDWRVHLCDWVEAR